jgi:co-chaperonin GroES (HSP10)
MTDMTDLPMMNDNVDWLNPEDMDVPQDIPPPFLWRICVMPVQPKKVSKGGIFLPVAAQDAEGHLQIIGKVVAIGPLAFRSFKYASGPRDYWRILTGRRVSWAPKVGDWVVYGRYTGQRCEYQNLRLVIMNDDELIAGARSAAGWKIYV